MTESGDDFEVFLKRRTVLPNGMSDDDNLEPPRALDALVLKQAREAVREQQRLNRAPRWAMPVALAATILLCLSVVLNVSLNTNRPAGERSRLTVASADQAPTAPNDDARTLSAAPNVAAQAEPARRATSPDVAAQANPAPAAVPNIVARAEPTPAGAPNIAARATPAPAAAPNVAARAAPATPATSTAGAPATSSADTLARAAAEGERRGNAASDPASHEAILPEATVAEARAARPPVLAESATPTSADALHAESPRPHGSAVDKAAVFAARAGTTDRSEASDRAVASRDAEVTFRRSAPEHPTESAVDKAAQLAEAVPAQEAPAPNDRLAAARQNTKQPTLAKRKATAVPSPPQDPKAWLHRIDALRAEGKTDEADAEMRRFRATFPAYPSPAKPDAPAAPKAPK